MYREQTPHWKVKTIDASEQRAKGFCPLTPNEVGMFLIALGYPRTTQIYIAAGEIYGGSDRMAGLLSHFPNVLSKVCDFGHHSQFRRRRLCCKITFVAFLNSLVCVFSSRCYWLVGFFTDENDHPTQ